MINFIEYLYESVVAEANQNVTIDFNQQDIKNLFIEAEDEEVDLKLNQSSTIYKYLKTVVKNPEFYSMILRELQTLQTQSSKLAGLLSTKNDEMNRFTSSAQNTKLNLICVSATGQQREEYINEILKYFNDKATNDPTYYITQVTKHHHELHFTPNKTNPICKKYKFNKIVLHLVQPQNNRLLNKISSDITEFVPAIALVALRNGKKDIVVKLQSSTLTPEKLLKILNDNKQFILKSKVCEEDAFTSLVNGITNNITKDIIVQKVEHAAILVNAVHSHISDLESTTGKEVEIGEVKVDNQKVKDNNDAADITATINGKPLNLSVKDDKIDGTGHSLRDFSLLKRLDVIKGLKDIYAPVSFDKFLRSLPAERLSSGDVNKKDYYRWIVNNTDKFEAAVQENTKVFAKVLQYVLNMENENTMILSHSGIHANITQNPAYASYALRYINDLEKGDPAVSISIKKSGNETQLITVMLDGKPKVQISAQVGAGKYMPLTQEMIAKGLESGGPKYVAMVIKYKDVLFKNFK